MQSRMIAAVILATVLLSCTTDAAKDNVLRFKSEKSVPPEEELEHLLGLLNKNLVPDRYKPLSYFKHLGLDHRKRVEGFVWKDCGGTAASVSSLSITPDPLQFPGTISIAASFSLNATLTAPLKAQVKMTKKIAGIPIEIPCDHAGSVPVGSCTYDDVCQYLDMVPQCPPELVQIGINCKCPLKQGNYKLPTISFDVAAAAFPSGDISIEGKAMDNSGKQLACLQLTLSIA